MSNQKYYIVSTEALPEVFIKVAEARRMLPGVLSNFLSIFANSGANILTINQTIPTNGCAGVTISAETRDMVEDLESMMTRISAAEGVLKFEVQAA